MVGVLRDEIVPEELSVAGSLLSLHHIDRPLQPDQVLRVAVRQLAGPPPLTRPPGFHFPGDFLDDSDGLGALP